jgi:phthiocerol/phenolphthiocerol synthesis type-I polyketide synthase E
VKTTPDRRQDTEAAAGADVAVVGMALRAPRAKTPEEYWRRISEGTECISFFGEEELLARGVSPELVSNPDFVPAGGVLEDADRFAASFFGYVAREAETIDPQHRVFLECAWEALEDAGCDSERYEGLIGVYAGSTMNTYMLVNLMGNRNVLDLVGDLQTMIGNDKEYLATRVSYKLDLRGPAYGVQTACSTSLVAIHVAAQALLAGECDVALAGGASVRLPQGGGYLYQPGSTSSPDGHCRTFDARAAGSVVGSGAGVVVLKLLDDAIADGDTVHAVIKGSAINNDGAGKASFTAPSVNGQATAVANAIDMAGVEADSIGYVEAHGTGTLIGDPIEVAALTKGFRSKTERRGFCALGSVKPNIGHLDAAAGVLSFIKAVLCLEHGTLPPSINFESPNPKIDFEASPFYVNTETRPWESDGAPRRAGVNSVGIGGTNAHVVLEEPPRPESSDRGRPWQLLPVSARTPAELEAALENLADRLEHDHETPLADVAHTLQTGRRAFPQRRVVVVGDRREAVAALRGPASPEVVEMPGRAVAFMFSGQGSQHPGMGRDLYEREPTFRAAIDAGVELLMAETGADVRDLILGGDGDRFSDTSLAQPALFLVEHALARLWMEWGVMPSAMIGHSIGEYVAACLAGVFSFEEGLRLVAGRGRVVAELPGGAMLAVQMAEEELRPRLGDGVSLAAVNAPSLCAVSGEEDEIGRLEAELGADEVPCRRLVVSHAFHSQMMEPALAPLQGLCEEVELRPPSIPFVSNVSGTWITQEEACDPAYWARHLRQPVLFAAGVAELLAEPARVLLEVGPGTALTTFAGSLPSAGDRVLASSRHPQQDGDDQAVAMRALGRLWSLGVDVDFDGFAVHERRRRVPLPTYPFARERFWIDPLVDEEPAARAGEGSRGAATTVDGSESAASNGDGVGGLRTFGWRRTPPLALNGSRRAPQRLLVLAGTRPFAREMVARLVSEGADVTIARPGEEFRRLGERTYVLDPAEGAHYEQLLAAVGGTGLDAVVHAWSVGGVEGEGLERELLLGAGSLARLTRALGEHPARLHVLADGAFEVTGGEPPGPAAAALAGACDAIAAERAGRGFSGVVDLDLSEPGAVAEADLDLLVRELVAPSERAVALRAGYRWVRTTEPVAEGEDRVLRPGGVYLVVGGFGAAAFPTCSFLAETLGARLAIFDRLAAGDAPGGPEGDRPIPRTASTLEGLGAEVLVLPAGSRDGEGLGDAVRQAREHFGELHGVLHVVADDEADAAARDGEGVERRLAEQIEMARALTSGLDGADADFCLLATPFGKGREGMLLAGAAGGAMESLAEAGDRDRGTRWVSVSGEEVGPDLIQRALNATPVPQVRVSGPGREPSPADPGDGQPRPAAEPAIPTPGPTPTATPTHARPDLQHGYVAPRNELERDQTAIWEELLGITGIGMEDNFFELGGSSLLATQLITRIRKRFGVEVALAHLFDGPTVAAMAETIRAIEAGELPAAADCSAAPESDEDIVAAALSEIEELEDDEVQAQLVERLRDEGSAP